MSNPSPEARYDFTIHTYGCKVNTYDTGLLEARLKGEGHRAVRADEIAALSAEERIPRVHILNTCAVTGEATKEAVRAVRRIKSRDPFAKVVVTGCGAQVDGETFDVLPGADLVVANSHKGKLERLLDQLFKGQLEGKVHRSNIFRKDDLEAGGGIESGHTRAFLKIQDGCNSFCTYCVIPFARGKSRSIPVAELITRVRELHARGAQEVVLTGVHIGDYEDETRGKSFGLSELVQEVLARTEIPRVRLTSLEPPELNEGLFSAFKDSRICSHFHMSIQSANTPVLAGMRRQYDAQAVEWALQTIQEKVPGAFVGMDVIVGFPGEGEAEFADTYERLARLPWTRIHVFPYSERPGTKAARFEDQVPRSERVLRSQRLRDLSTERYQRAALEMIGQERDVLLLKNSSESGLRDGLSRDYWPVRVQTTNAVVGAEMRVKITGFEEPRGGRMDGVLVAEAL